MRTTTDPGRIDVADRTPRTLVRAVRLLGGALLAAMAGIHLALWLDGFRDVPWIGPLFVANVVLGALAAGAVLLAPRRELPWVALLAGLLAIGTLAGLVLSLTVGLFGYHETSGGYVLPTIVVEAAAAVVLAGYGGRELLRSRPRDRGAGSWAG
jgi:hypothetical protein